MVCRVMMDGKVNEVIRNPMNEFNQTHRSLFLQGITMQNIIRNNAPRLGFIIIQKIRTATRAHDVLCTNLAHVIEPIVETKSESKVTVGVLNVFPC